MKKIHSLLLTAATTIGLLTACSDVPMPYDINGGGSTSFGKVIPYKTASLSSFSTHDLISGYSAWSQGSSYTQATGYQAWGGAASKSNKEVKSYLISPPLNTNCESGKVRFSFDQTLRYTNNVNGWQENHKIYISKNFDGNPKDFERATWTLIDYTPEASTYSDWTLYSSGYIKVPDEFVNHDSIYIAFYFYAPASASTTWELENFLIEEGEADNSGEGGKTEETLGTKEEPLTVAEAIGKVGNKGYVAGYIVGYVDGQKLEEGAKFEAAPASETELLLADSPDETSVSNVFPVQLPAGDIRNALNPNKPEVIGKKVTLYGSIEPYFGVPGMKSTSWAEINGVTYGTDPEAENVPLGDPKGDGTQANPYNVAAAIQFTSALSADKNSDAKYIEGIICNDPNIDTGSYGNATFYISDDGTDANKFYIFRIFDIDNQHFTDAKKIKRGDKVVIYSPLVNYKGNTPETVANMGYLISINGEGGGNTPPPPQPAEEKGTGTESDPFNVAATIAFTSALDPDKDSEAKYIEGIICSTPNVDTGSYGNATFYISDDGTDANKFYVFRIFDIGNQHFTDAKKIKKGDKVVIYSPLVNYKGNTPETSASKGYLISINDNGEGGGGNTPTPVPTGNITRTEGTDDAGVSTLTIVNNDVTEKPVNPLFYDFKDLGLANNTKLTETYTIGDNLTVAFDGGTNTTLVPKYYTSNTPPDVRIYANNNIYLTGSSPIQKVVMTCSSIASGPCTGNKTMTFSTEDGGRKLTICNASETAGTQLRIQTISVYYGE